MQIIDDLEPVPRGPYCGAAGWIGIDGTASLNVAIRTALVRGDPGGSPGQIRRGVLDYSVGAGIVADSDPASEWRETLDKAGILRGITGGSSRAASRPGAGSSRGTSG
jgi:para-aminobenzoate synthetase component 1